MAITRSTITPQQPSDVRISEGVKRVSEGMVRTFLLPSGFGTPCECEIIKSLIWNLIGLQKIILIVELFTKNNNLAMKSNPKCKKNT